MIILQAQAPEVYPLLWWNFTEFQPSVKDLPFSWFQFGTPSKQLNIQFRFSSNKLKKKNQKINL